MSQAFVPMDTFDRALRYWWVVVLFGMFGALSGWVFQRLQPPVYSAETGISVSIDYARTGTLTDTEEDFAIGIIGDVISSPAVLQETVRLASEQNLEIGENELLEAVNFERRSSIWIARFQHRNAQSAMILADAWSRAAYTTVERAHQHALTADVYSHQIDVLERCLEGAPAVTAGGELCSLENLGNILDEIQVLNTQLSKELRAAMGVLPYTSFAQTGQSVLSAPAVTYRPAQVMLAGSLIGLLLGVIVLELGIVPLLPKARPGG
jgi:hypothetical protein